MSILVSVTIPTISKRIEQFKRCIVSITTQLEDKYTNQTEILVTCDGDYLQTQYFLKKIVKKYSNIRLFHPTDKKRRN